MYQLFLSVDPDVPSAVTVSNITQTSVTVSWSVGETQVVNSTVVYYKATDSTSATWSSSPVTDTATTHTVTSLEPGTEHQFYVTIESYGKTSTSETVTATTGMMR